MIWDVLLAIALLAWLIATILFVYKAPKEKRLRVIGMFVAVLAALVAVRACEGSWRELGNFGREPAAVAPDVPPE